MKRSVIILMALALTMCVSRPDEGKDRSAKSLLIYVGAASKPPVTEIIENFQRETGVKIEAVFGGSGFVLSQMKLAGKGDIYFPGSSDFMEIAKREKLVYPETEQQVVYLVNAINVQPGNPKNIQTLKDLCRPGLRVAIATPDKVCVGAYAVEIVEKAFTDQEKALFRKNLVNYMESCDKTAAGIALKTVDAVIGWSVFEYWNPESIASVPLKPEEIIRIGYIPVAVSTYTRDRETAQQFIDYVMSPKGKGVFNKFKYFANPQEAKDYIGADKPVGGEYSVPDNW